MQLQCNAIKWELTSRFRDNCDKMNAMSFPKFSFESRDRTLIKAFHGGTVWYACHISRVLRYKISPIKSEKHLVKIFQIRIYPKSPRLGTAGFKIPLGIYFFLGPWVKFWHSFFRFHICLRPSWKNMFSLIPKTHSIPRQSFCIARLIVQWVLTKSSAVTAITLVEWFHDDSYLAIWPAYQLGFLKKTSATNFCQ